ncbi:MAG: sodium/proton-translocating pyrophosphatase, partial [Planctomycetaceae bacterium]
MKRATALVITAILLLPLIGCGADTVAAEAPPSGFGNLFYVFWWLLGVVGAAIALFQAWQFFQWMEAQPAGTQKMIDIAGYVRTGADAYLKQQYKVVGWAFLAICILLLWM